MATIQHSPALKSVIKSLKGMNPVEAVGMIQNLSFTPLLSAQENKALEVSWNKKDKDAPVSAPYWF